MGRFQLRNFFSIDLKTTAPFILNARVVIKFPYCNREAFKSERNSPGQQVVKKQVTISNE